MQIVIYEQKTYLHLRDILFRKKYVSERINNDIG